MPKSSAQIRADQAAKASRDGTGPTDADVVRALRHVFERKCEKSWGDKEAPVTAALRFVADKNCHNFATLTEIVNTRTFAGKKGGMFVEAGVDAYIRLQQSLQENQSHSLVSQSGEEKHKKMEEKPHTTVETETPYQIEESGKAVLASAKPVVRGQVLVAIDEAGDMLTRATNKARAELKEEFEYEKLCEQGKRLFTMVLNEKAKRIHSKMKCRLKKVK